MLGLSFRERVSQFIYDKSKEQIYNYKESLKELLIHEEDYTPEEYASQYTELQRIYLRKVSDAVFDQIQKVSPITSGKVKLILMNPEFCGHEELAEHSEADFSAGELYAICYTAFTRKIGKKKDYENIDVAQAFLMYSALCQAAEELGFSPPTLYK